MVAPFNPLSINSLQSSLSLDANVPATPKGWRLRLIHPIHADGVADTMLKIAFASDNRTRVNLHFGSATTFLTLRRRPRWSDLLRRRRIS
jgi:hypothetical protein